MIRVGEFCKSVETSYLLFICISNMVVLNLFFDFDFSAHNSPLNDTIDTLESQTTTEYEEEDEIEDGRGRDREENETTEGEE